MANSVKAGVTHFDRYPQRGFQDYLHCPPGRLARALLHLHFVRLTYFSQRCLLNPSKLSLAAVHLDVCALKLGSAHPDEDDLVKFLRVFAEIESINTIRILSVPESLGKVTLLPDFSSRPEEPHEQADGKIAKSLSKFSNLEHLTLIFGYRPSGGLPSFWRQFSGRRLVSRVASWSGFKAERCVANRIESSTTSTR